MKSEYIFPTVLIALDVCASVPYAVRGNLRMMVYWLAAAHSFPKGYKLVGTRADQVKQIGNSVPVRTAKAIVKAMFGRRR